jgi:hypothetical protein
MMVETQYEKRVKILRSDNDTKYTNKSMQDFLRSEDIIHQTTCVNTSEQNGVAERKNRHILEVTRCLLFSMNVPRYLWGEATKTVVYLINRMPLRAVEFHTPLEILTGKNAFKVPTKIFGCVCFVHNTVLGISKLDVRAHKCIFVGYSRDKKGYRCFDPIKMRMYESMDVTFRESESYFSSAGVPVSSSTILTDFLDIVPSPYVNTTDETSREGETVQAKEKERVQEVEEGELVDTRGGQEEEPLVMLDLIDSGTDSGIIPPFEKHYV